MVVATQAETVSVMAEAAPVIKTEVSNIAETKTGQELVDLPLAVTARSTGSTSALSTLTSQPGVQTDASGNISVVGTKPSMLSTSIDGISSIGPRTSAPLAELFPSNDSIAEIRVSEVNNTAEFGGISDITTISKGGSNSYRGGLFENLQNTVLNARNPFSAARPKTIMNNFGFFVGGPLSIPGVYQGKDKTFFFVAGEALRLPKEQVVVSSVPSLALRNGDLSAYSAAIKDPNTGHLRTTRYRRTGSRLFRNMCCSIYFRCRTRERRTPLPTITSRTSPLRFQATRAMAASIGTLIQDRPPSLDSRGNSAT